MSLGQLLQYRQKNHFQIQIQQRNSKPFSSSLPFHFIQLINMISLPFIFFIDQIDIYVCLMIFMQRSLLYLNSHMFSINVDRSKSVSFSKSFTKLNTTRCTQPNTHEKTRLYDLPKILSYYKIDRPSLGQYMKRNIEEKLQTDKQVEISLKKRNKNKDFFLNYVKNPFTNQEADEEKSQFKMETKKEEIRRNANKKRNKVHNTIVDAVNSLRELTPFIKDRSLRNMKKDAVEISASIQEAVLKTKQTSKMVNKSSEQQQQLILKQITLDEILTIEQQNFYITNQKPLNIFQCIKSFPKILNNTILNKYNFSFISIVDKPDQNIRFPIYRDISRKARISALKNRFSKQQLMEFITSTDINTNLNTIRFEDMLGLASGRCTPELISDWINKKEASFEFETLINNKDITLKDRTFNVAIDFQHKNSDNLEVEAWKFNQNLNELNYYKKCEQTKGSILARMDKKVNLNKQKIIDINVHNTLTEEMKRDILYFLQMNANQKQIKSSKPLNINGEKLTSSKARNLKNNQMVTLLKTVKNKFSEMQKTGNKTSRV